MPRSTESSRRRARAATRRRLYTALEHLSQSLSYGADITDDERAWMFFEALRRIEDAEHMALCDRITEPPPGHPTSRPE